MWRISVLVSDAGSEEKKVGEAVWMMNVWRNV